MARLYRAGHATVACAGQLWRVVLTAYVTYSTILVRTKIGVYTSIIGITPLYKFPKYMEMKVLGLKSCQVSQPTSEQTISQRFNLYHIVPNLEM